MLEVVAGTGAGVEDRERAVGRQCGGHSIRDRFVVAECKKTRTRLEDQPAVADDAPGRVENTEVPAAVAVEAMPVRAAKD